MEPHMPLPSNNNHDSEGFNLSGLHGKPNMGYVSGGLFSVGALSYGFGDCAFDIAKADACVAHAASLIDKFQAVGMHLITWAIAIFKAAFAL